MKNILIITFLSIANFLFSQIQYEFEVIQINDSTSTIVEKKALSEVEKKRVLWKQKLNIEKCQKEIVEQENKKAQIISQLGNIKLVQNYVQNIDSSIIANYQKKIEESISDISENSECVVWAEKETKSYNSNILIMNADCNNYIDNNNDVFKIDGDYKIEGQGINLFQGGFEITEKDYKIEITGSNYTITKTDGVNSDHIIISKNSYE